MTVWGTVELYQPIQELESESGILTPALEYYYEDIACPVELFILYVLEGGFRSNH